LYKYTASLVILFYVNLRLESMEEQMNSNFNIQDLSVDAYTTPCPTTIADDTPVTNIIDLMDEQGIRHLPVVNNAGQTIGVITDRDVKSVQSLSFRNEIYAKDIMTEDPLTVYSGTSLVDAAFIMSDAKIGSLLVNDDDEKMVGIFTNTDALNALVEVLRGDLLEEE
jgi:acetoin utilization protein AcuB